jgi:nucleoside-diphosphate-sugar epimerase
MKVLIVGGAGYVGSVVVPALEAQFDCTHLDLRPVPGSNRRTRIADVADADAVSQAVAGMDAVVYLAMGLGMIDNKRTVGEIGPAFDVNVRGLYRSLVHALKGGTRRFVYASTLSVYKNYFVDNPPLQEDVPADAWDPYGLSKRVGEFICEAAVREYPAASICALRLMMPVNERDWPPLRYDPNAAHNVCALGPEDTRRLFVAAVQCDKPGYHCLQATGDMEDRKFSNRRVHEVLGWLPNNA